MEFEELLKPLAAACGVERLEPDESHMVHFGADGSALTIVGDPETRMTGRRGCVERSLPVAA